MARRCAALGGWMVLVARLLAADEQDSIGLRELPAVIPAQAAVLAYAREAGIAMEGIEAAPLAGGSLAGRAGDKVTVLVTLSEKKKQSQWLVRLEIAEPTEKERGAARAAAITLTTAEHTHTFEGAGTLPLEILAIGPFKPGQQRPAPRRARTLISPDFLALGLDEACRVMIKRKIEEKPGNPSPKISREDERVILGMFPALMAFLQGVQDTPALREILWDVLEKPSAWSMVKSLAQRKINFGLNLGMPAAMDPAKWAFPDRSLYTVGLDLAINGKPALKTLLVVASPQPPLLTTAGVLGIVARPPSRTDERVDLRILSGQRGPPRTEP